MNRQKPMEKDILYQLMNYEYNQRLLESVPHIRYLDMAIVFYYWENSEGNKKRAGLISNENMQAWGYTLERLEEIASYNTPRKLPVTFEPIEEVIREILGFKAVEEEKEPLLPMYILSNKTKLFGAAAILYPQVLWAISQSLEEDIYVLPSSIHECIIVPSSVKCSPQELERTVTEINRTQVPDQEILSNRVFFYQKKEDCLGFGTYL